MKDKIVYLPFDAATVALQGSNLIEASAGTGKTYSIALLALRLILENDVPVDKILMVTFTKAAVAELQERVRKFIRLGYDVAQGKEIDDATIALLVKEQQYNQGALQIEERLKDAVLLLDELSIMTIHGFCQQTLTEFAFETGQLFGAEMFTDMDLILEQELNAFWRSHITTMDLPLLSLLGYEGLRQEIRSIVKQQLDGKQYEGYSNSTVYQLGDISVAAYQQIQEQVANESKMHQAMVSQSFVQHQQDIEAVCRASRAKNKTDFLDSLHSADAFIQLLNTSKPNVLTAALPERFMSVYSVARTFIEQAQDLVQLRFKKQLYYFAIQEIGGAIREFLLRNNLLGYNDLIQNLYRSLVDRPNPALVAAMQDKYSAVFVDEFQDTDREQYEIFATAFPAPILTFFIGDPKQSIYAWRKADIFTYFAARSAVDKCYSMNVNFRSAAPMITAMNSFFLPEEEFDTFSFAGEEDSIDYTPIESPSPNAKGVLMYGPDEETPISIFEANKKEEIQYGVAQQIQALLTNEQFFIAKGDNSRRVKPSDIGILVRRNGEATGIKNYLARLGIPAVTINDSKILHTPQALEFLYLLEAIWEPGVATVNRALLSSFCGFNTDDILRLNQEVVLALFQQYKEAWTKDGIYPALTRFVKEFQVRERLQLQHAFGERIVANVYQLIEVLNQAQQHRELSPEELISWLKRAVNGIAIEGDEFQMRMESDDEAVKIITIHKSKGLEYNIVFAPFLDMNAESKHDMLTYRHPENGDYVAKERKLMTQEEQEWNRIQLEQENRRLIYVAITRAVYKCYIYKNNWQGNRKSGLSFFLNGLKCNLTSIRNIEFEVISPMTLQPYRSSEEYQQAEEGLVAKSFKLNEEHWRKLSYTAISAHGLLQAKERTHLFDQPYDEFVFNKLRFGAATGNLLHQLLEDIDFAKQDRWDDIIARTLKAYLPSATEAYAQLIKELLENIVGAEIKLGYDSFSLSDVPFYKRISELEFDFPLLNLRTDMINHLAGDGKEVFTKSFDGKALEGIMNGKIDLFFEHQGRFYVLDWKSNYLGYQLEDYNREGLLNGMNENNYHLQYLIYTVAVKKYLESRLPDFDYEKQFGGVVYLFMRGLRRGSDYGIFTARPSLKKILTLENMLYKKAAKA